MAVFKKELLASATPASDLLHTILLVDDEPDNLDVLSAILSDRYHILVARDGQEALELVTQMQRPELLSLVISDQRMPRLSGVQLCEQLCALSPETLRIIITGYIDVDAIVDSVNRAKIYQFVIKPFDRHDFELTVQRAVEAYEMKRDLNDYVLNLETKVIARTQELQQRNEELHCAYQQLERFSITDPLTGLHNRRYLQNVIEKDLVIARREHPANQASNTKNSDDLVFFLIDCDHFKMVNDAHGHDVGDQMLCAIASVLRQVFRESDYLIRWGGEEFLVVARFIKRSLASEMAERLRQTMADMRLVLANGEYLQRTCSIGFAAFPFLSSAPTALDWSQIVKFADCAMYCAKQSGRNTWVGLSAGDEVSEALPKLMDHKDIPHMLEKGQLQVESKHLASKLIWI
ncbi:diguanylate cyclase [Undibacterium sp.]|uniref:GGDEF domain-containing response regulator n=1 Tax=Undibacterium sp. TaxID=1914977 RepID=UPI0025DE4782|nr:diguanylate cyclase [Undibacterium sp.]